MYRLLTNRTLALTCSTALLICTRDVMAAPPPMYQLELVEMAELGTTHFYDINNNGLILGKTFSGSSTPFLYESTTGGTRALPTYTGATLIQLNGVNDQGDVTGAALTPYGWRAFKTQNGTTVPLGLISGQFSEGQAINTAGVVVGRAQEVNEHGSAQGRAFKHDGSMLNLGVATGHTESRAWAISDTGHVVGTSGNHVASHAARFTSGGVELIDFGGAGVSSSFASGVNSSGDVVGTAGPANGGAYRGFLQRNGESPILFGPPAGQSAGATDINDSGVVIGRYQLDGSGNNSRAFVYTDAFYELNSHVLFGEGVTLKDARAVNNAGQIVGDATIGQGKTVGFILTPVTVQTSQASFAADETFDDSVTSTGGTVASFLGGTSSEARNVEFTFTPPSGRFRSSMISDVLTVEGTGNDTFVLQMSYDPAGAGAAAPYLAWLNDSGEWVNAVEGNVGGTSSFVQGAYDPGTMFALGNWGVDTQNHVVWAVLNHNSAFVAAAVVPEPASLTLLALTSLALLRRRQAPPSAQPAAVTW